jgi:hypothetical protein
LTWLLHSSFLNFIIKFRLKIEIIFLLAPSSGKRIGLGVTELGPDADSSERPKEILF